MFHTEDVTDFLESQPGVMKVPELFSAIQRRGIKDDVVVDVRAICVGRHQKGVLALGEPHPQFIADPVGFLRRDFSRLEGLANLVGDHIVLLPPARDMGILALRQQEFFIGGHGVTLIPRDQLTLFSFCRVLCIIRPVTQTLRDGFPFVDMQCNQSCRRHSSPSFPQKRRADCSAYVGGAACPKLFLDL